MPDSPAYMFGKYHVDFLVDRHRTSYAVAARHYAVAFRRLGMEVNLISSQEASQAESRGRLLVHHTIGPLLRPIPSAVNVAVIFHEWSRYPQSWLETLADFHAVWAPTQHVFETLHRSGLKRGLRLVPPPLDTEEIPLKDRWDAGPEPFRFFSVGQPHFRKGFHLLIEAFKLAFPSPGRAELVLQVGPECNWASPRPDIVFSTVDLDRSRLLSAYSKHDAYVTASLGEGLGLPLAEAVMALLPVAANHWGGHRDVLSAGNYWAIPHVEIPQVFASEPSYYAQDQTCAYSAPEDIARSLVSVVSADARTRAAKAHEARRQLLASRSADATRAALREALLALLPALGG